MEREKERKEREQERAERVQKVNEEQWLLRKERAKRRISPSPSTQYRRR
ncbi:unnamed protein product [Soboliphyme baturini]|uniref:Uncharacterized protein n=1 Tax=Soboliphyme baturini TaxID=241478 RepID=A0A183IM08_9BILA|nr:unnamed protein product [Soboliphyme baturini]